MFYESPPEGVLRYGDILEGFVLTSTNIAREPINEKNCLIHVEVPNLCVLLTPCCTIRHKKVSISPLIELDVNIYNIDYLAEDPTRINTPLEERSLYNDDRWDKLPPQKKAEVLNSNRAYFSYYLFIYEPNPHFQEYTLNHRKLGKVNSNYYMVDFRNIFVVDGENIKYFERDLLGLKRYQLTDRVRQELREKFSFFYSRQT